MKIRKIIAAFLLALMLILSLSACKDDGKSPKKEKPTVSSTQSEDSPSKLPDPATTAATTTQAHTTVTLPSGIQDGWEGPPVPLP